MYIFLHVAYQGGTKNLKILCICHFIFGRIFYHSKCSSGWQIDTFNQVIMVLSFTWRYLAPLLSTHCSLAEYFSLKCLCQMPMTYILFCQLKYLMQVFFVTIKPTGFHLDVLRFLLLFCWLHFLQYWFYIWSLVKNLLLWELNCLQHWKIM